ncbi:DNA cytosine methyltransferase [Brevibacillus choshinensis]|uniref:Cytosine-specific methyltransferase n=1 Tax=Brevibacillus choshinensis TaxID=54911 RepID=A0ABX7FPU4_BRECH|nr:DNA (cytosine-5-)-methyltransferase [Brevibacillus choshinensis]QRG67715.1 DNA (cytosine-5-)-methyltransferase [Brevibacillus choshinensis]
MRTITFADLCAGIGGFRYGLEKIGWKCVYSCEVDDNCEATYKLNYKDAFNKKDIADINPLELYGVDVFCSGFPCQPFSIAGKQLGFEDPRGEVFNHILRLVDGARPAVVFLENVANLVRHNNGETFSLMVNSLKDLNYNVFYKILDSSYFGVPQRRSRVYIVAFRNDCNINDFIFTEKRTEETHFRRFIKHGDNSIPITSKWQEYIDLYTGNITINEMSFNVPKTRQTLERISPKANLNDCIFQIRSSGIRAISLDEPLPTFAVSHSGGGAMIPVYSGERRHINITEMKRIMGFPDNFKFNVSRTHVVKQLANAVCPPVIESIGLDIRNKLIQESLSSAI